MQSETLYINELAATLDDRQTDMKKILSYPTHKLVIGTSIPLLIYVCIYELWLTNPNNPSCCWAVYRAGVIASRISYSFIAASIFYLVTQYLGIYVPKQRRKVKIVLPFIHRQVTMIDLMCETLKSHLNIHGTDFKDRDKFRKALRDVKVDKPIGDFKNWHQYLYDMKIQILDITRGVYFYNEYLDEKFLHEIIIIESKLMSPITFVGYKTYACTNLSYAELDLQEILVHNYHLQTIREAEDKKYEKEFEEAGKEYRQTYYADDKNKGQPLTPVWRQAGGGANRNERPCITCEAFLFVIFAAFYICG